MKKIVGGMCYDTAQATEVGSWSNDRSYQDFKFLNESLYKTESGAYFLFGEGGAMTEYCEVLDDGWTDGTRLTPMSRTEAFVWAQLHLSTEIVIGEFGDLIKCA